MQRPQDDLPHSGHGGWVVTVAFVLDGVHHAANKQFGIPGWPGGARQGRQGYHIQRPAPCLPHRHPIAVDAQRDGVVL
eukprot:9222318-Lingulodinium_polyedra.AAC.1